MSKTFQPGDYVAVHAEPVWRHRSNFLIRVYLEQSDGRNEWEQLWARRIDDRKFSLCCIPFFAYNLALGDEVETDATFAVQGIVKRSGHFTFRVWFGDSPKPKIREDVLLKLETVGALFEWSSPNLLAVSAIGTNQAQEVADYLCVRHKAGDLMYETARA